MQNCSNVRLRLKAGVNVAMESDGTEKEKEKEGRRDDGRKESFLRRACECACVRGRKRVAERRRGCAPPVCPMLSVVAMGMLLIGRRADRRHGSRGATPTIARPRAPPTTRQRPLPPPPSPRFTPFRGRGGVLSSPPLPHLSLVRLPPTSSTRTPRQSLLQTRPNTLDTRLTTESRLPGNLNFPSVPI